MEQSPLDKANDEIEDIITASLHQGPMPESSSRVVSQEPQAESNSETLTPRQREARIRDEMVRNALKQGENPLLKNYERENELEEIAAIMSDGTELTGNHTGGHRAHVSIDTDGEW